MSDLRPYSGRFPHCDKCGHDEAGTRHTAADLYELDVFQTLRQLYKLEDSVTEFMSRRCGNCGYEWAEDVVKASE